MKTKIVLWCSGVLIYWVLDPKTSNNVKFQGPIRSSMALLWHHQNIKTVIIFQTESAIRMVNIGEDVDW